MRWTTSCASGWTAGVPGFVSTWRMRWRRLVEGYEPERILLGRDVGDGSGPARGFLRERCGSAPPRLQLSLRLRAPGVRCAAERRRADRGAAPRACVARL